MALESSAGLSTLGAAGGVGSGTIAFSSAMSLVASTSTFFASSAAIDAELKRMGILSQAAAELARGLELQKKKACFVKRWQAAE